MNTLISAPEVNGWPKSESEIPTGSQEVRARMTWRVIQGRLQSDWRFDGPLTPAGELWKRPARGAR